MKYAEAIRAIQDSDLEDKDKIVAALSKEGESQRTRADQAEALLNQALEGFGSQEQSAEQRLEALKNELATAKQQASDEKAKREEAEGKILHLERRDQLRTAATKSGANVSVLEHLLDSVKAEDLKFDPEGNLSVGGKPLKEYAEGVWGAFLPALFPNAEGEQNKHPEQKKSSSPLPSGGTKSTSDKSQAETIISKRYTLSHLRPKT